MTPHALEISDSLREPFLRDHVRLEALFERLLVALEANDRGDIARYWTEFESGLLGHMETEEAHLFPVLQGVSPKSARILVQEHRHIRTRLTEIGMALHLHSLRLDTARAFIDEVRAHARSEDRLLYQWADGRLDPAEKTATLQALARSLARRAGRTARLPEH